MHQFTTLTYTSTNHYLLSTQFRLWHPDLTQVERLALQYIYDCLEEPLLLSTNEDERMLAERRINELRTFPKLNSGSGFGGGGGARGKKQKKNSKKKR